jgi:ribosomal protein S1
MNAVENGDEIRAFTINIDRQQRNVELRFVRKLLQSSTAATAHDDWNFSVGQQLDGKIVKIDRRGFVLVQITEETTGLLHIRDMDEITKKKFDAEELQVSDQV